MYQRKLVKLFSLIFILISKSYMYFSFLKIHIIRLLFNYGYENWPEVHLQSLVVHLPSKLVMKKNKLPASQASEL